MFSFGTASSGTHDDKTVPTKSKDSSSKGSPSKPAAASRQTSPSKKWKPTKKHAKSLSAKALADKSFRSKSVPDIAASSRSEPCSTRASPGPGARSNSPPAGFFELSETSPRGQSTTRPKHIPIVIPTYTTIPGEQHEVLRSGYLSTFYSGSSGSPAIPHRPSFTSLAGSSIADLSKPRHVEIKIPSWAQPVLKQASTPPRLALSQSTFIDPFANATALSPADMSRPTPDSSRTNTMDSTVSPNQLYASQSNSSSRAHLQSANSSQSSLVGMRAEYESASEAESTHDEGSNTPSQSAGTPATGRVPGQMTPSGTSTANLSGLVCNVHRTTGKEPAPLVGATTTVLGDKLYVFGGRRLSRTKPQLTANLYELDLVRRHWTKLDIKGDVPPPRYFHSMCTLGDSKLVCYGGMSPAPVPENGSEAQSEVIVMSDIHMFDVPTHTWMRINTAESPQGRYAHCAAILPSSAVFASSNAPMSAVHHNPSGSNPNQGTLGINIDGTGGAEMVVVGGQDSANHYIEQVSIFNLRSLKWTGTTGMGRSCGAYRSVVTPLTSMSASQIGAGPHARGDVEEDEDEPTTIGSGAPMLIYSNYNFLDVKLELQIRLTDGTLTEKPMSNGVSPPGLRFPNGGIIDHHFVVSGTFLTSSKQEYALWALDLRTLTWSRIDAGGSIFSQGSWNRGVLWSRRNSFVILGNRKRSLVDDYNNRRINFSNICIVELEAFGLYDNARRAEPTSAFVSASAALPHANGDVSTCGRQLSYAAEELGALSLAVRELADMDLLAIDGTTIPVNSRLIARRWGQHFINLLRESLVSAAETDTATLRPSIASQPSRNSSITITPSVTSGATTLTNNTTASDLPDTRTAPPPTRPRLFYLPHTAPTLHALLHYLYTSTLPSPPSPLATPQILCSLLQLARPYKIDGLLEAVVERLHESLDGRNAAAIFNAAAMAAGGGEGVQFAADSGGVRDSMIPLRGASLASDGATLNGLSRAASSLRIDTEVANGRTTRNTLRPGQVRSADEDEVPDSAATDVSMSESDASLSARSLTGRAARDRDIWTGALSAVVGLQKRGLRGLMEGRRLRERGRSDEVNGHVGLGIA
ncbi:hypothetical protein LTS12_021448 [Elasticomyces elasticus]|nr:hypothetical protein LTS12_021448 [Elasticomyces elasticus]